MRRLRRHYLACKVLLTMWREVGRQAPDKSFTEKIRVLGAAAEEFRRRRSA